MKKKALSLLESIIATILLSITMLGLANVFVSSRRHIQHSRFRIVGAEAGKLFLERLPMDVNEGTWGTTCLSGNSGACPGNVTLPDGAIYRPAYDVSAVNDVRRVKLTINWTEWY